MESAGTQACRSLSGPNCGSCHPGEDGVVAYKTQTH